MPIRSLFSKTAALALALGCAAPTGASYGAPAEQPAAAAPQVPGQAPRTPQAPAAPAPAGHVDISFAIHKTMDVNPEGPEFARSYFTVGTKRMAFGMPKGVRLSVGDGFMLLPTDDSFDGEVHITQSPFAVDYDLVQNALQYREAAERDLPKGATDVVANPPVMDTYPFNGWKSQGFSWTYSSFGRSMVRTVNYINLNLGVQIIVTTLAKRTDAEKVDKVAKQFVGTWWVMPDKVTPTAPDVTQ